SSVFFLQDLEQHALFSELELNLAICADSVGLECYSSSDQSFSTSFVPLVVPDIGSTTLNDKVIVTLSSFKVTM
nr:hypothetical protein [Tanacetum cinerariifolium]